MTRREAGRLFWIALITSACAVLAMVVFHHLDETRARGRCAENLRRLGELQLRKRHPRGGDAPRHAGAGSPLHWRAGGTQPTALGDDEVFICPGDPTLRVPTTDEARWRYDDVDLTAPDTDLCSYMVRDFRAHPLDAEAPNPTIVAADRQGADHRTPHHSGGLNVLFSDGSVRFLDRAALGLSPDDVIEVGPGSKSEMLRVLSYSEARKE